MMKTFTMFTCVLVTVLFFSGCSKKDDPSDELPWQGLTYPDYFGKPVYDLQSNPITKTGFELGRKLFYDPILSRDNTIACGSCHNQSAAMTHHGHDVSHGIDDRLGKRNSLPVQNLLWQRNFFWDGGVHNMELIPLNAITNPVEMDETPENVLAKLRQHPDYPKLFKQTFGSEEINSTRFLQALAQYMAMLVSDKSRYDQYLQGKITLTNDELTGKVLFETKCGACHAGALQTDHSFRNNGLNSSFMDKGRYEISLRDEDIGKFKVPSLRNVERTWPYMHDGRFNTLKEVLDFYSSNVKVSTTLDTLLNRNNTVGIPLTEQEKSRIIDFLKTLSDDSFIRNPTFAEQ